ncbi:uncharacterized protein LOC116294606, partial [Actinia tenebrosa]|uniref:Uncharacterized protein LOC116294606 n=1 Tax=Actinia tenebrosa TaxID=6105 RepID=A0A6P8HZR4_ACTTE
MPPKMSILIKCLNDNHSALEKLSKCLDREFPHIKCWLHFAEQMKIEKDVICQCRLYSEYSPTVKLFEFLKATRPELSVKELTSALEEMKRIDIQLMVFQTYKSEDKVSRVITDSCSDHVMDDIAQELDSASKPLGNWEKLAQNLGVPRDIYQRFAMYSDYNPTVALVRYLYTTSKKPILLKDFMDCFHKMGREDVLKKVKQIIKKEDMKDLNASEVLKVGSDDLQAIAVLLNEDIQGGVQGWRQLGNYFNVDSSIMDVLEPPKDKEVHSPTAKVISWLTAARPSTTIDDVAKALEKIKRYDALKILRSHFN